MDDSFCGQDPPVCGGKAGDKRGWYLCPSDQKTCVPSAEEYVKCPGMRGTHLDWTLDIEARLDYLANATDLQAQVDQLQNGAPALVELGIPAYQWLNDDQHGVARTTALATVFPNGCALGATWSTETLAAVGAALGDEARGLHNGFLHAVDPNPDPSKPNPGRDPYCNGCGITLYSPNLNIVRDPRCE